MHIIKVLWHRFKIRSGRVGAGMDVEGEGCGLGFGEFPDVEYELERIAGVNAR
jgi:hypothetical protein